MSDLNSGLNTMLEHRIRRRAHEIYKARMENGCDWQDWLKAEREVLDEIKGSHEISTVTSSISNGNIPFADRRS